MQMIVLKLSLRMLTGMHSESLHLELCKLHEACVNRELLALVPSMTSIRQQYALISPKLADLLSIISAALADHHRP